jgi:alpha-N-arabinofuranosidase
VRVFLFFYGEGAWTDCCARSAGTVIRSTSYYVQQMFSLNRGDAYLPSTPADPAGQLFWSVVQQDTPAEFIIKLSNTGASAQNATFELPAAVTANGTLIQLVGGPTVSNTPEEPDAAVPVTTTIETAQELVLSVPGYSVSVVRVPLA